MIPNLSALYSFIFAILAILATTGVAFAGDLTAGQTLFKVCAVCHDVGEK